MLDEFWDEYPNLDRTEVRSSLGVFMFSQEEVFKTVDMLSGGEKVRLALCKIFKTKPNFLILDERTNHMDIVGKDGTVTYLPYGYEEYLERRNGTYAASVDKGIYDAADAAVKAVKAKALAEVKAQEPVPVQKGKESHELGRERSRLEKKLKKLEDQIAAMEEAIEAKKEELLKPEYASSYSKLGEITAEIEEKEMELLGLMEEWETADRKLGELE